MHFKTVKTFANKAKKKTAHSHLEPMNQVRTEHFYSVGWVFVIQQQP